MDRIMRHSLAVEIITQQLSEEKPGSLARLVAARILKRLEASGYTLHEAPRAPEARSAGGSQP